MEQVMTESEKIEMLLRPRWKVAALWPNTEFKVGDIIAPEYYTEKSEKFYNEFPHLFKKLEWYEERAAEEMPEYVVRNFEVHSGGLVGDPDILKVAEHFKSGRGERDLHNQSFATFTSVNGLAKSYSYIGFLPATESEYLQYTKPQP